MQTSIWLKNAGVDAQNLPATFEPISNAHNLHFDVAVVGGGVVGCTLAYLLKSAGKSVALIEARTIGSGTTGFSTAKLSAQQGCLYSMLASKHGKESAREYYDMNTSGIALVQKIVDDLSIDCGFSRRSHTSWTSDANREGVVYEEYELCAKIGIPCTISDGIGQHLDELPQSIGARVGITFPDQAQFNPYKYCMALARHIHGGSCAVFEHSRVDSVDQQVPHTVSIPQANSSVIAGHVMLATHLPILDRSMHFSMLQPSKTHCIAFENAPPNLRNMFYSLDEPIRSLRYDEDSSCLVLAGNTSKVGERDSTLLYQDLERWAKRHFGLEQIASIWSAMDYMSADHIPFIGYLYRGTSTIYTATGFSKWGLASGVMGAKIVSEMIQGKAVDEIPFAKLVDARRWDLSTQWKSIAEENVHVVKHFVGDKLKHSISWANRKIQALENDEGGVCSAGGQKVGAYRDSDGVLHVVRPSCTHLGCDLEFNNGDRIWECPCHGSQFDIDGNVIHGPACKNLHEVLEW